MHNPFARKTGPGTYEHERLRLLEWFENADPESDDYHKVMSRLNDLDKIMNRTSELKKTLIPALGTVGGVASIYALQQFAGVIVPKALESIAARQEAKKTPELD